MQNCCKQQNNNLMQKNFSHATLSLADNSAPFIDIEIETEWLSTIEAANYLKLSPNALRIMVCRGKVVYFKIGNRLRFRKSDLTSLLLQKGVCS